MAHGLWRFNMPGLLRDSGMPQVGRLAGSRSDRMTHTQFSKVQNR
jgi:hypothetical protein